MPLHTPLARTVVFLEFDGVYFMLRIRVDLIPQADTISTYGCCIFVRRSAQAPFLITRLT
jgi:hypothetical protein